MAQHAARWLGIDITTTEMALAVADHQQREGFAAIPMRGALHWNGDPAFPAFDLNCVPGMLFDLLEMLRSEGWDFSQPGLLSLACRQHDLVVQDAGGQLLLPALSWQCHAAVQETRELNGNPQVTDAVGRVEERFILPKLAHVLRIDPGLRSRVARVMTTGDWLLGQLSGEFRLSTSDALSNGLLNQATRDLAREAIALAGLDPVWFPEVIQSGHQVGRVGASAAGSQWGEVQRLLKDWQVVAGLGDNHASALGCGMRDQRTMVVSAGTSGTINLALAVGTGRHQVDRPAVSFEFYRQHTLLLRMLASCGDWYNRFLNEFAADFCDAHQLLNDLAVRTDLARIWRVECDSCGERYRAGWTRLSLGQKVASVQFSITLELLLHVRDMLAEVPHARQQLTRYVLTGGLSQSPLVQRVFQAGIESLDPGKEVMVSGRTGPLRYKTSAYGALLNARMPEWQQDLEQIPDILFPLAACDRAASNTLKRWQQRLQAELVDPDR